MGRLSRVVRRRMQSIPTGSPLPSAAATDVAGRPVLSQGRRGAATAQRILVIAGTVLFLLGLSVISGFQGPGGLGGLLPSESADAAGSTPASAPIHPAEGAGGGADPNGYGTPEPVSSGPGDDDLASPDRSTASPETPDPSTPTGDSTIGIDLPLGL